MATPDLVIRNVSIHDGDGGESTEGDVEITEGRISNVGTARQGTLEIDGDGMALSPGFVDVHTHDDGALIAHPGMHFKLAQGCTSVVVGNCGFSAMPPTRDMLLGGLNRTWKDLAGYLATVEAGRPAVNVMSQIGHNTVRQTVLGMDQRAPTSAELDQMKDFVEQAMEQGACGLTTGLIYQPGRYSRTEEIVELAAVISPFGGIYNSHMRNEGDRLLDSVDELIRIGHEAGCSCHISHHKSAGAANWGKVGESLAKVDAANAVDSDITLDVYPYTAGSGPMHQYYDVDNVDEVLASNTRIASCVDFPEMEGRALPAIADQTGESLTELVRRIVTAPQKERTICVQFIIDEADIEENLRHPLMMIGSDGIPDLKGRPHPRLFGTFPRVLARYVRERNILSLPEAIKRMTSMSADRFGLVDRGRIVTGAYADLVMFDADAVTDLATYDEPSQEPTGLSLVVVNGQVALRDGVHSGVGAGRALRYRRPT